MKRKWIFNSFPLCRIRRSHPVRSGFQLQGNFKLSVWKHENFLAGNPDSPMALRCRPNPNSAQIFVRKSKENLGGSFGNGKQNSCAFSFSEPPCNWVTDWLDADDRPRRNTRRANLARLTRQTECAKFLPDWESGRQAEPLSSWLTIKRIWRELVGSFGNWKQNSCWFSFLETLCHWVTDWLDADGCPRRNRKRANLARLTRPMEYTKTIRTTKMTELDCKRRRGTLEDSLYLQDGQNGQVLTDIIAFFE